MGEHGAGGSPGQGLFVEEGAVENPPGEEGGVGQILESGPIQSEEDGASDLLPPDRGGSGRPVRGLGGVCGGEGDVDGF